jgi:uncharacterized membrane protein YbhN (UPF0104 family)
MWPKLKAYLRYALLLGIGITLLWLSFRGIDLRSTLIEFKSIDYGWLFVSILASIFAFISRAYRWNLLIHPMGYRSSLYDTTNALMVGYLVNLAVPRLGEVTRCGSLNRTAKVPFEILLGTVIVERLLDVICLAACLLLAAWIEHERLGEFLEQNIFVPLSEKAGFLTTFSGLQWLLILVTVSATIYLVIRYLRSKPGRLPGLGRFSKSFSGIIQGLRSVRTIDKKGAFIFHTVFIWFMYFLMSYTCFKALPATAGLDWEAGLFVLVAGGIGMSAPVQGGIGAYHLLVSRGLTLYGLTLVHGLAFATLMHTSQTLLVIIMGAIAMLLISMKTGKNSNHA